MKLRTILDEATNKWGVKVNRVELQDINPPTDIKEAMEKQMRAERTRRAQIIDAEGTKTAAILEAEGRKPFTVSGRWDVIYVNPTYAGAHYCGWRISIEHPYLPEP